MTMVPVNTCDPAGDQVAETEDHVVMVLERNGMRIELREDGKFWHTTAGVAIADVPFTEEEVGCIFKREIEPELHWFDGEVFPSDGILEYVRDILKGACTGEAAAWFARRKRENGTWEWRAWVPEQKATMGGWTVEDLKPMYDEMGQDGWDCTTHGHLHPGRMKTYSSTDEDNWIDGVGAYVIAPREGEEISTWVSVGSQVFHAEDIDLTGVKSVEIPVMGVGGETDLKSLITKPVFQGMRCWDGTGWPENNWEDDWYSKRKGAIVQTGTVTDDDWTRMWNETHGYGSDEPSEVREAIEATDTFRLGVATGLEAVEVCGSRLVMSEGGDLYLVGESLLLSRLVARDQWDLGEVLLNESIDDHCMSGYVALLDELGI